MKYVHSSAGSAAYEATERIAESKEPGIGYLYGTARAYKRLSTPLHLVLLAMSIVVETG